jgi:hypothetical protein
MPDTVDRLPRRQFDINPLHVEIVDITIEKFNKTDRMSIKPQFVEVNIFQSIFEPFIKAEILINDQIGMFVNYPFTGEELITISYNQTGTFTAESLDVPHTDLKFIIRGVRNISLSDRARSLMYILDLVSPYYLQNTRKYVSHAYSDKVENAAEQLFLEYLATDTQALYNISKPFVKEESLKVRSLVIPNIRPVQGITWLAKHAIAKDSENHFLYLFYEDLDQFNFITLQQKIQEAQLKKDLIREKRYVYFSDAETNYNLTTDKDADKRLITNIVNNKRFSSIEKIAGGYYQNELFEISLLQKAYNSTPTEHIGSKDKPYTLEKYPLNTQGYINYVKNEKINTEYSNRIRYVINNYDDFNDDQGLTQPGDRYKFGNTVKYLNALNQIDLSITVPANMDLKPGQVIYCAIPEMHGFTNVIEDIYLSGFFVITEIKQVLMLGNKAATSLRIQKDGYLNLLLETSEYDTSVTSPRVTGGHA